MIHFGRISRKNEWEFTCRDLLQHSIWICRHELATSNSGWARYFPVLMKDPDVNKEMVKRKDHPQILVTVPGRKLYARASYWPEDRCIIGIYFWRRNKWIHLDDMKLPRPLTLVPIPKILGEANVPFYLLTKKDIAAPRVGGHIHRPGIGAKRFLLGGDLKTLVRLKDWKKWTDYMADQRGENRPKETKFKFGRAKHLTKITLRDHLKNPIWAQTYEEEGHDEEHQRPVLKPKDNVTRELCRNHDLLLACQVEGQKLYASASYDSGKDRLYAIAFWERGRWRVGKEVEDLGKAVTLISIPKMFSKPNARFILDGTRETARRAR